MFTYRLAERLHMIRSEMLARMSWKEFQMWAVIANMDAKASGQPDKPPEQTPQQILAQLDMIAARQQQRRHAAN